MIGHDSLIPKVVGREKNIWCKEGHSLVSHLSVSQHGLIVPVAGGDVQLDPDRRVRLAR